MESVNLDMGDIFEEEAGEDDFPSIGPLPDLPDREEGVDGDQDEESSDVMSKLKDLSKGAAKKVIRRPMPKLDSQRLTGERGIPILPKVFEKVQFKGKGNEAQDLRIIMRYLEHWAHRLFPMMPFDEVLERIEKLGTKKEVQTCIKKMRLDMPLLNDEYIRHDSDEEEGGNDSKDKSHTEKNGGDEVDEDVWEEMMKEHEEEQKTSATPQVTTTPMSQLKSQLSKPLMDLNNSSPSKPYTATPIPCSSGISWGLTPEQRERLERNKQLALQKKLGKQGFKTPAVPPSPFRSPQSSPVISRLSPAKPSTSTSSPFSCKLLPSKAAAVSSPCKLLHSSPSKSPNLSSLVQNGVEGSSQNHELGVNKLSCDSTHNSQSQQSLEIPNGETQSIGSQNDWSEDIHVPIVGKMTQSGKPESCQNNTEDEDMSEVIPNQDLKRNIEQSNDDLVKKQKIDNVLTEEG